MKMNSYNKMAFVFRSKKGALVFQTKRISLLKILQGAGHLHVDENELLITNSYNAMNVIIL